jgi:Na+/pantothenate symporter
MEIAIRIVLVLHLIGWATIFGYAVTQIPNFKTGAKVAPGLVHGAWLTLVAGLALAGMLPANGEHVNAISISVKSVAITAIFFIAYTYQKKEQTPKWVVPSILLLTILNIAVAVLLGMTTE